MLGAPELSQGKTPGCSGSLGPARRLRGELSEVLMSEVREGLAKKSCFAPLLLSRLARRKEGEGTLTPTVLSQAFLAWGSKSSHQEGGSSRELPNNSKPAGRPARWVSTGRGSIISCLP